MITIQNDTTHEIYRAGLVKLDVITTDDRFGVDVFSLPDISPSLPKKWDPIIDMYVMDQHELDDWIDFWKQETERAHFGISNLLESGVYYFWCERYAEE